MHGQQNVKTIWCLLPIVYLNMSRASLCPWSEQDCVLPHMAFSTGCAGRGRVELHCVKVVDRIKFHTVHTVCDSAPHDHGQHNQCWTPNAVVHSLVLLTMGIVMPETCWGKRLIINIRLVACCWFLSLPCFHDARSQELLSVNCKLLETTHAPRRNHAGSPNIYRNAYFEQHKEKYSYFSFHIKLSKACRLRPITDCYRTVRQTATAPVPLSYCRLSLHKEMCLVNKQCLFLYGKLKLKGPGFWHQATLVSLNSEVRITAVLVH